MTDSAGAGVAPTDAAASHDHPEMPYDPTGAKIGMWLFLFTEVLLFGSLFIMYAAYLNRYTWQFVDGSQQLSVLFGGVNTVVLLTSSLTMALSISALQRGHIQFSQKLLNATIALAFVFVVIKSLEWGGKIEHGIYPNSPYLTDQADGKGLTIFYNTYFVMTGLHALHVIAGIAAILWAKALIAKGKVTPERSVLLDNVGLYWHLVDLVWIFLFPLFYLIG